MTSIPDTMKAMVLTGHGDMDMYDWRDVPVPQPAAGEVLVKVGACGLNNTDVNTRSGIVVYSAKPPSRSEPK